MDVREEHMEVQEEIVIHYCAYHVWAFASRTLQLFTTMHIKFGLFCFPQPINVNL